MHMSNFMRIHLVGAELSNVDGQTRPTDMKLIVTYRSFVNVSKKVAIC